MTTVSEYKLTHAPEQVAGGILIDPDNGNAQQHVDHLRGKYGERLVAVFQGGEQVFPYVMRSVSHALLQA